MSGTIAVKERPILFSAPMVQAILAGRKTQTRRVVKKWHGAEGLNLSFSGLVASRVGPSSWKLSSPGEGGAWNERCAAISLYGKPGDRLWVREAWQQVHPLQVHGERFNIAGRAGIPGPPAVDYRVIYRADGEYPRIHFQQGVPIYPYREVCMGPSCQREHLHPEESRQGWIPSIHMPRWASRITLEVTEVRVQRLQEINFEDCMAEGVTYPEAMRQGGGSYRLAYEGVWESIHGPGSWNTNPWVWAVSFKVVQL